MIKLAHPIVEEDEQQAVLEALRSGQLAQGPRVAAFERAFAEYVGVPHAVAVNSGTAALHTALLAHDIGSMSSGGDAGDEVIVPAFSFAATANTVLQAGARPAFVDIRDRDFNIDTESLASAITPRTRAIVGVHLYGQVCDAPTIRALCDKYGLIFVEDAAQAVGGSLRGHNAGSIGTGCFSFYATKNLTTGEGGMITTNDAVVAERARAIRSQGERTRYVTEELGWNYRMTEPAAALGLAQLAKLDARNRRRRENAARLNELLAGNDRIVTPNETPGQVHAWHQYTIRVKAGREARDRLQSALHDRGIESVVFYPAPIHQQPLYRRLGYGDLELPVATRLAEEVLSLPIHPALSGNDLLAVADAVNSVTAPNN
ncbi:MAG: DegT/DnrJ/EryC1/StrS aminotransferase family protein [Chloroflexi bacterium]|nr:DegT/DnrJ/EryC1/StrS aminotransferase family protein [Chloroflexota bacterium]